ncbi:MAG: helix-turn-helix domain-containing protein [Acidimicrobiales bacterium]
MSSRETRIGDRDQAASSLTAADPQPRPQWMSVQAAARELEVTTRTIYRFINDGKLTAYRIGWVYRIRCSDLAAFLADAALQPGDLDHLVDDRRSIDDRPDVSDATT